MQSRAERRLAGDSYRACVYLPSRYVREAMLLRMRAAVDADRPKPAMHVRDVAVGRLEVDCGERCGEPVERCGSDTFSSSPSRPRPRNARGRISGPG